MGKRKARIVSAAIKGPEPECERAVEFGELGDLSTQETARDGLSSPAIKGSRVPREKKS